MLKSLSSSEDTASGYNSDLSASDVSASSNFTEEPTSCGDCNMAVVPFMLCIVDPVPNELEEDKIQCRRSAKKIMRHTCCCTFSDGFPCSSTFSLEEYLNHRNDAGGLS